MANSPSPHAGPSVEDSWIIVLAAEQERTGAIGAISARRCQKAAELFQANRRSKILVSGGASNQFDPPVGALAYAMADYLFAAGVPRNAILVEPLSSSTHLSAVNALPLLAGVSGVITVVTSGYHCFRAVRCFRRCGVAVHAAPVVEPRGAGKVVREACKVVYYWLRGWV